MARIDNLEFLSDVVPMTMPYKLFKEKKAKETAAGVETGLPNGQRTLTELPKQRGSVDQDEDDTGDEMQLDESASSQTQSHPANVRQLEQEMRETNMNGYHGPDSVT